MDPGVRGYPNLQTEFQDSPGNTEKPCLKNKKYIKKSEKRVGGKTSVAHMFLKQVAMRGSVPLISASSRSSQAGRRAATLTVPMVRSWQWFF